MEYVISPVWAVLELAFAWFLFDAFMPRRSCKHAWAYCLGLWVVLSLFTVSPLPQIVVTFITLALVCGVSFLLFSGSRLWHVMLTLLTFSFVAVFDLGFTMGMCTLLGISAETLVMQKLLYTAVITFSKLVALLLGWLFRNTRKGKSVQGTNGVWLLLTLLFPAVSCVIQFFILFLFRKNEELNTGAFVVSCCLGLANVGILYLIRSLQKSTEEAQRIALLNQQIAIQMQSMEALEKSYQDQRAITHEHNHNLTALKGLLEEERTEDALNVIDKLLGTKRSRMLAVRTSNAVMDAVLNQKYQAASDNGIDFQLRVNDLSAVKLPEESLVVVLSNLLDNAIEACILLDTGRKIQLTILAEDVLFISIRNTSLPVMIMDGKIPTTKEPQQEHGFGLPNIQKIVDSLHGDFTMQYENGWFEVAVELPIM